MLFALVMAVAWLTVSVKLCVASAPIPLCAVNEMGNVPLAVGVPLNTPVAVLNVTPPGKDPDSESDGAGNPVATTVKVPAEATVKVLLFALVMAGAWFTVRVKLCEALEPTPLCAVNEMGNVPLAVGVPLNTPVAVL